MTATLLLAFVCAAVVSPKPAKCAITVARMRCEYLENPIGIDELKPRLSWILRSDHNGQKQTAYQILVSSSAVKINQDEADLWDSGKVESDESVNIEYGGPALRSGERAFWKVRVWDANGNQSAYSEPGFWETGLLVRSDWKAQWIGITGIGTVAKPGVNGYHSQIAASVDAPKWVAIDLGQPQSFSAIKLFPARPFDWTRDQPGFLFPIRFKIEVSDSADFSGARTVVDQSSGDLANPGTKPVLFNIKPENARYIRLSTSKLGQREAGEYGLCLAEMQVISGDQVISTGAKASASDSLEEHAWSINHLTDGDLVSHAPTKGDGGPAPYLRKAFRVEKPIVRARVYASAKGLYDLYLDGKRVNEDSFRPGWTDYNKRIQYQTFDVTKQLAQGDHAIGMILGDGWYCGHVGWDGRGQYGPEARGLAQVELEYADGSKASFGTDGSWKATTGAILSNDLLMGEEIDARKEVRGWSTAKFDDSQWQSPTVEDLNQVPLVGQHSPGVQPLMELKPHKIHEPKPGVFVYDLGQNMVGWARLHVKGAPGTRIQLRFAEMLNKDGTIYTENLRGAKCTDVYVLNGSKKGETFEPRFTFHGFRYVEVTGFPGKPGHDAIRGIVAGSNDPQVGAFECSSTLVNKLVHNIQWGQRGNYLEVPTDCPQRDERLGWMGDAQIFCRTATYNADVSAFMTKWVQDIRDAQGPEGGYTDVTPRIVDHSDGAPAWADAGIIVPWTMYLSYGDKRMLERHYDSAKRWIEYVDSVNPNHLWVKRSNNNFGDWLNVDADMPRDVLGTAYFAYSTRIVSKMAKVLGHEEDAAHYGALFEDIRKAFNEHYVKPDGEIHGNTQTCYVVALWFDLLSPEMRELATKRLVDDVMITRHGHLSTGFVGVGYLTSTLSSIGANDVSYKLLLNDTYPSWGYSIKQGATTIWERWDGWRDDKGFQDPGMNSFNHYSLGSVGEWLYHSVAGIDLDPSDPGFKHVIIKPMPGPGLDWIKASYDSIRGKIESRWRNDKHGFEMEIEVPTNCTATVYVPTSSEPKVKGQGAHYESMENGYARYQVGGGKYRFESKR